MGIRRIRKRLQRMWATRRLRRLLDITNWELTRLGTAHGGWIVPQFAIAPGRTAVLAGAGEDISFDVELNKRGLRVFTLDPTPRARDHVRQVLSASTHKSSIPINNSETEFYDLNQFTAERLTLLEVGLWNRNTSMKFFAPRDSKHVSHSIVNLQGTEEGFEAHCITLRSFCKQHNIRKIDMLKLDIEGAEYVVLKDMIESGIKPQVLCVEFDELRNPLKGNYMGRIRGLVTMLKEAGYRFCHVEESNALFVVNA
jgi:FkbM family methyltransferase